VELSADFSHLASHRFFGASRLPLLWTDADCTERMPKIAATRKVRDIRANMMGGARVAAFPTRVGVFKYFLKRPSPHADSVIVPRIFPWRMLFSQIVRPILWSARGLLKPQSMTSPFMMHVGFVGVNLNMFKRNVES